MPTENQLIQLKAMMNNQSKEYCFVTSKQIDCLGIDTENGQLNEWIADHSKKILQENETYLSTSQYVGNLYTVDLLNV